VRCRSRRRSGPGRRSGECPRRRRAAGPRWTGRSRSAAAASNRGRGDDVGRPRPQSNRASICPRGQHGKYAATKRLVRDDVAQRGIAVQPAECEREARAGRGERLEAERLEHSPRTGVPRVRDHERLAHVPPAKRLRLPPLSTSRRHAARPCPVCPAPCCARTRRARRRGRTPSRSPGGALPGR
jgi:hypothetical protein